MFTSERYRERIRKRRSSTLGGGVARRSEAGGSAYGRVAKARAGLSMKSWVAISGPKVRISRGRRPVSR
ncbi:hypothetical protein [Kribbella sp. NPDC051620]|uniref:hypothetical protein n=1 Tax=Kribbella sp. NPDC051620 TaxID=3364120 RepID=UPI0037A1C896